MDFQPILTNAVSILTAVGIKVLGAIAFWLISSVGVDWNIARVVAILGYFRVETTTFAALITAGIAWAGLILRPLKAGDFAQARGITGTVHEIGLFAPTTIVCLATRFRTTRRTRSGASRRQRHHCPTQAAAVGYSQRRFQPRPGRRNPRFQPPGPCPSGASVHAHRSL